MIQMQFYPHQQKALNDTEGFNRVAYYLDMGLGKTFVGAEKMHQLDSKVNLVVCQKSKIEDWVQHFTEYYPDYDVLNLTTKQSIMCFQSWVSQIEQGQYKVVGVINYDLLYRRSYFAHMTGFTLMLDESSIIQNETAKRSKFILGMNPDNVILLSGTPTAGKYEKLWSQIHLLGWNISKKLYYAQYIEQDWIEDRNSGFRIPVVTGYKNVDRLKSKLARHGAVFMKTEEAFDLPQQIEVEIKVNPTKEYKKFMRDSYLMFDTKNYCQFKDDSDFYGNDVTPRVELIGDTTLSKKLYARQLCGQYNKDKLNHFRDLIESTEDRLIVFYNFNEELHQLRKICESLDREVSFINGSGRSMYAYEEVSNSVTLVQYQAGAMGVNLQKANKIIYFTLPERSELFEQSKKRIHRIGQEKACFYYYLTCPNTVETNIRQTLAMRKDYTDALFEKEYGT